jgi:hypothetical protein
MECAGLIMAPLRSSRDLMNECILVIMQNIWFWFLLIYNYFREFNL